MGDVVLATSVGSRAAAEAGNGMAHVPRPAPEHRTFLWYCAVAMLGCAAVRRERARSGVTLRQVRADSAETDVAGSDQRAFGGVGVGTTLQVQHAVPSQQVGWRWSLESGGRTGGGNTAMGYCMRTQAGRLWRGAQQMSLTP